MVATKEKNIGAQGSNTNRGSFNIVGMRQKLPFSHRVVMVTRSNCIVVIVDQGQGQLVA